MNFEKSMAELELIVKSLESGELSLEKAIASFEKGVTLIKDCKNILDEVQGKVTTLVEGLKDEKTDN